MYLIAHVFIYLFGYTVGVYQLSGDLKSGKMTRQRLLREDYGKRVVTSLPRCEEKQHITEHINNHTKPRFISIRIRLQTEAKAGASEMTLPNGDQAEVEKQHSNRALAYLINFTKEGRKEGREDIKKDINGKRRTLDIVLFFPLGVNEQLFSVNGERIYT